MFILYQCSCIVICFFFFKQKTAYEMRISDWSSDVCSSDLPELLEYNGGSIDRYVTQTFDVEYGTTEYGAEAYEAYLRERYVALGATPEQIERIVPRNVERYLRSEEQTSELQSLMRNTYDVFCLKKKKHNQLYEEV